MGLAVDHRAERIVHKLHPWTYLLGEHRCLNYWLYYTGNCTPKCPLVGLCALLLGLKLAHPNIHKYTFRFEYILQRKARKLGISSLAREREVAIFSWICSCPCWYMYSTVHRLYNSCRILGHTLCSFSYIYTTSCTNSYKGNLWICCSNSCSMHNQMNMASRLLGTNSCSSGIPYRDGSRLYLWISDSFSVAYYYVCHLWNQDKTVYWHLKSWGEEHLHFSNSSYTSLSPSISFNFHPASLQRSMSLNNSEI